MGNANGMRSGLKSGRNSGSKSRTAQPMMSGLKAGITSGLPALDKIQNPLNLSGIKKPLIYCNADNLTSNTGTVITLTDLIGSGYTLTNAQGTSFTPDLISKNIFNNKDALDFNNSGCSLYPTPSLSFPTTESELSVIMVLKLKSIAAQIFYVDSNISPGGVDLSTIDTSYTLRNIFYGGQSGTMTNSQYDSYLSTGEGSDWMILTAKYRLNQPQGAGSEQELYINSRLQKKLNSESPFTVVTTTYSGAQTFIVGNTSTTSGTRGASMYFGAFILCDYWLNEVEQLRLENYFRWYYGNKF